MTHPGTAPRRSDRSPTSNPKQVAGRSLFDPAILRRAVGDSFVKLDPRLMARNPVMFVVEVGSVLTTHPVLPRPRTDDRRREPLRRPGRRVALVHRAVRQLRRGDGRGPGQGAGRHPAQDPLRDHRPRPPRRRRDRRGAAARSCSSATCASSSAGELIPGDGEIVEGIASVDESAITGESAPVIRESGGDRSAVTGGTRVLSDQIVVRITAKPGETLPRPHDRPGRGRRAPEDPERDRPQHPAGRAHAHLPAGHRHPAALRHLLRRRAADRRARRPARLPDPHDDRRAAVGHRHRRHGPPRAAQRAGHVAAGPSRRPATARRCCSTRPAPSPSATGRRPSSSPAEGVDRAPSWPRPRSSRAWPTRRPRAARSSCWPRSSYGLRERDLAGRRRSCRSPPRPACRRRHRRPLSVRKGAADSVQALGRRARRHRPARPRPRSSTRIATTGGTPLAVADGDRVLGVIHLKDIVKQGMAERFDELRRMGIRTVMITGDNPLTAAAIAEEAGVDDFLAEATPEDKMALIKREQAGGNLVAMTGDGTNDAPALAQADVGVAMNTGTQAAKEAGNMVDLDSDPTKLIEIVEIGKQLLITRGSLTTFSIANDVAKYFAIIPAMFVGVFPALDRINVMDLDDAALGDPLGGHLQRPDHRGADPARAAGREVPGRERRRRAAPQPPHLRPRRAHRPVRRHQAHRPRHHRPGSEVMRRQLLPALRMVLVLTVLVGLAYPLVMTGVAQVAVRRQGRRLARRARRRGRRLRRSSARPSAAPSTSTPARRPPATGRRRSSTTTATRSTPADLDRLAASGARTWPDQRGPPRRGRGAGRRLPRGERPRRRRAGAGRRRHRSGSGLDPHISVANARLQAPRVADERGPATSTTSSACRRPHRRPLARVPRRAGRERARAQPRPRRGVN